MNYNDAMDFINSYTKSGGRVNDLSRFRCLLEKVLDGRRLSDLPCVHVAGTNGKGSVVRYIASVLEKSGYKTAEFTSPFIHEYADRIRINEQNIPKDKIAYYAEKVKRCVTDGAPYSQFEITTAIALLYFFDEKCDIAVIECGLGGLLDCTNILEKPLVSVITSVSLDHTAILGDTIEKITVQKAGIIKNGCPVVLSYANPESTVKIVAETAKKKGCGLIIPEKAAVADEKYDVFGAEFSYKGKRYKLSMGGHHQIYNATAALETIEILRKSGFSISDEAEKSGLLSAKIPYRLEVLSTNPLKIRDGAHNPAGMESLAAAIDTLTDKPAAIIGMMSDKDIESSIKIIAPHIKFAVCRDDFSPRACKKDVLCRLLNENGCATYDKMPDGYGGAVVICGTLYM